LLFLGTGLILPSDSTSVTRTGITVYFHKSNFRILKRKLHGTLLLM
jgi:hypothetical protein